MLAALYRQRSGRTRASPSSVRTLVDRSASAPMRGRVVCNPPSAIVHILMPLPPAFTAYVCQARALLCSPRGTTYMVPRPLEVLTPG